MEKPVICTGYSGNLDFCDSEYQELIDYKLVSVDSDLYSKFFNDVSSLKWAEPNIKSASVAMRKIFNNKEEYNEKAYTYRNKLINSDIFDFDFKYLNSKFPK